MLIVPFWSSTCWRRGLPPMAFACITCGRGNERSVTSPSSLVKHRVIFSNWLLWRSPIRGVAFVKKPNCSQGGVLRRSLPSLRRSGTIFFLVGQSLFWVHRRGISGLLISKYQTRQKQQLRISQSEAGTMSAPTEENPLHIIVIGAGQSESSGR